MPNPRGTRPSPFDTVQTKSRGFKKFTRKFEAFRKPSSTSTGETIGSAISELGERFEQAIGPTPLAGEEFQGVGHKVIEIITPAGNEARVHLTGLSPFTPDPFGILNQLEGIIIDEIREIVGKDIDEDARKAQVHSSTPASKVSELTTFAKKGSQSK